MLINKYFYIVHELTDLIYMQSNYDVRFLVEILQMLQFGYMTNIMRKVIGSSLHAIQ